MVLRLGLLLRLRDVVERLDEPVALRLGLEEAGRLRRGRLDGKEEDPQPECGSAVGAAAGARCGGGVGGGGRTRGRGAPDPHRW